MTVLDDGLSNAEEATLRVTYGESEGAGTEAEAGEPEDKGGGEGRTGAEAREGVGTSTKVESQDGGEPGRISALEPGSRDEGRVSRCSMNVTWKELKIFPEASSQRR